MKSIWLAVVAIVFIGSSENGQALGCSDMEYEKLMDEIRQVRTMEDLLTVSINNSSETTQAVQFSKDLERLDEHLSDVIKRLNEGCSNN
jgi:hypothetical protein